MPLLERLQVLESAVERAAARSGRERSSVTVVAVSKSVDRASVEAAYALGIRHFGENRVHDAATRFVPTIGSDVVLHMIGQLQTNKAARAVELFSIIESVDRPSLIAELDRQGSRTGTSIDVLLQVNVAKEARKAGCAPDDALGLVRSMQASSHLLLRGLMMIAPLVDDAELVRPYFRELRMMRDRLEQSLGDPLPELSMGMSNDFQVAIEEGATTIRVGRTLFAG